MHSGIGALPEHSKKNGRGWTWFQCRNRYCAGPGFSWKNTSCALETPFNFPRPLS